MPPKPKFKREEVLNEAFEILKEKGMENVSARNIAKRLNCAVSPIFTLFSSMDELKKELRKRVNAEFLEYINGSFEYDFPFKEFGIRWIMYTKENKNLFKTIFGHEYLGLLQVFLKDFSEIIEKIQEQIVLTFKLSKEEAYEVLNCLTLQVEGITAQILSNKKDYTKQEIAHILGVTCLGIVNLIKLKNGTFDEKIAKVMSENTDHIPLKIIE